KQDQNGLKCTQCKRVYPIRDDIPVMLVDEARIEE
ncbi:MAG: Trm112 family protein, partial [Bryobacteraceae bacterium]